VGIAETWSLEAPAELDGGDGARAAAEGREGCGGGAGGSGGGDAELHALSSVSGVFFFLSSPHFLWRPTWLGFEVSVSREEDERSVVMLLGFSLAPYRVSPPTGVGACRLLLSSCSPARRHAMAPPWLGLRLRCALLSGSESSCPLWLEAGRTGGAFAFAHLLFQGPHVLCGLHFCILRKRKKEKEKVDDSLSISSVGACFR
jgi:hypothetical protein